MLEQHTVGLHLYVLYIQGKEQDQTSHINSNKTTHIFYIAVTSVIKEGKMFSLGLSGPEEERGLVRGALCHMAIATCAMLSWVCLE